MLSLVPTSIKPITITQLLKKTKTVICLLLLMEGKWEVKAVILKEIIKDSLAVSFLRQFIIVEAQERLLKNPKCLRYLVEELLNSLTNLDFSQKVNSSFHPNQVQNRALVEGTILYQMLDCRCLEATKRVQVKFRHLNNNL